MTSEVHAAPSVQSRAEVYRNDLFGDPVQPPRKGTTPGGYASPMAGPEGETCATCKWAVRTRHYSKCGHPIMRPRWTHGVATDIRLKTRACAKWEKP